MRHWVWAMVLLAGASMGWADVLVTKDGKTYEGRVVSRTDDKIVFEAIRYGARMEMNFLPEDVKEIREGKLTSASKPASSPATKPQADDVEADEIPLPPPPPVVKQTGKTYCVIPLHGMIGKEIAAGVLDEAFKDILKRKPTVIVLEMESPGGYIHEVAPLVNTIQKYRDFHLVVLVKQAISAAAITTMSVREIYTTPGSIIGAATAYRLRADGMPEDIEEKMRSIWRATARNCAELGDHDTLLAEAMIEAKHSLEWVEEDGKKFIREGHGPHSFLDRGKLLALTAQEAVKFGLAAGSVEDYAGLGKALGMAGWKECPCYAPILMENWAKNRDRAEKNFDRLEEQLKGFITKADQTDPARFTYTVNQNGIFSMSSRQKWLSRSVDCIHLLDKASATLEKISAIAQKYPENFISPETIKKDKEEIETFKSRVQTRMDKKGRAD